MEFTIQNLTWRNEGLFGEDTVSFDFDVMNDEPEPYMYPCFVQLSTLLQYLPETNNELAEYIKEVRSSIDGWGPKESKLLNELGGAVDFEPLVYDLFNRKGWFVSEYERWKRLRAMPLAEHKKVLKFSDDMEQGQKALHQDTKNYYDFCESTEKAVQGIAVRIYPEILDMDKEKRKEFKYLFTNEIKRMQEVLVKFMDE
jgi:hypothetical protein